MKAIIASAWVWAVIFGIGGASLVVAGVEILAGRGWSMITGGGFMLSLFWVMLKGMKRE